MLIYKKLINIMRSLGPIKKDQENTFQGYKFRGIEQIVNALNPRLIEEGVIMRPRYDNIKQEVIVLKKLVKTELVEKAEVHATLEGYFTFFCEEDGSLLDVGPIPGEGVDSSDKATNKAMSASLKYALTQTFCIATKDMVDSDADDQQIPHQTEQQKTALAKTVTQITQVPANKPLNIVPYKEPQKEPIQEPAPIQQPHTHVWRQDTKDPDMEYCSVKMGNKWCGTRRLKPLFEDEPS